MNRYIDADALKRKAQKVGTEAWKMKMTAPIETTLNQFIDWIDNAPSIDIEPKQGEWIESFKSVEVKRGAYLGTKFVHDGWSCSECSEVVEKRYPNCPYCLARMKGADDE